MSDRCELCMFARKRYLHQSVVWECHEDSPRGVEMPGWAHRDKGVWPTIEPTDWCGKFMRQFKPSEPPERAAT